MKTWSNSFILILGERKLEVILLKSRKYHILPDSGCTQEIVPFNMHLAAKAIYRFAYLIFQVFEYLNI